VQIGEILNISVANDKSSMYKYGKSRRSRASFQSQAVEFAEESAITAVDIRCRRGEFQFMAAYKSIQEGPRRTASAPTHR
jgi:hypothetical protein